MMAPARQQNLIWAQARGAAAGVAEAPHLGSPDLGASGVGEGGSNNEIAATYDATSRRSAAVETAQQLLGDGQSRSYVQCGEK